jgi:DNA-binding transcriptional MocR family regulator
VSAVRLSQILGISTTAVENNIAYLKERGYIRRIGQAKGGHWEVIAKDLPWGSGLIESGNKHVIQARMKIPGASWSEQTAENFVCVRAMRANLQWEPYWEELKNVA